MDMWVPEVGGCWITTKHHISHMIDLRAKCPLRLPPQPFPGFNDTPFDDTEKMAQFHIHAANTQLRQAYFGFVAAMGLDRVLVMPRVSATASILVWQSSSPI